MFAWMVRGQGPIADQPLERVELPVPVPGPGEVLLRVLACGVCHTDLHIAEGDLPLGGRAVVPGHQIVGAVAAAGPGVVSPRLGAVVGVTWLAEACGRCEYCREGRENLCPAARFTGYHRHGGFAEYTLARAEFTVALPAGLAPRAAAPLLCAGVVGYRALRSSGVQPGQRRGLVGFGASAHLVIQVARHWGCEVFVFTRGAEHQAQARRLGAAWTGGLAERAPALCHSQVLFAPVGALVPQALGHLAPGGTLAINAVHMSDIPAFPYSRLFGERTVKSVSHVTRQDAREFLALAAAIPVQAQCHPYPLDQANAALAAVKSARMAGAAVLEPVPVST